MAFRVVTAAALVGVVAGGACTSDDPQKVAEAAEKCGALSYNVLTGVFDKDKFDDCFAEVFGLSKACAECYAAAQEYGVENCKADCLLGWCKSGCLACNAPAQEDLATCTGFATPTADPCEETLKEEAEGTTCTLDEQSTLVNSQTVGVKSQNCGELAYNIFTDEFDHDKFDVCFTKEYGVSRPCAECYAVAAEYSVKNCKADCLLGWCKSSCLDCNDPAEDELVKCAGVDARKDDPCEEMAIV